MIGSLDKTVSAFSRYVANWLHAAQDNPDQLVRWLQGFDLPPVGHMEEPYTWILRGLPDDDVEAEVPLANVLGTLLANFGHQLNSVPLADDFATNLFYLCANVSAPDVLCSGLRAVLEKLETNSIVLGPRSRSALLDALIVNQVDNSLEPLWLAFLTRQGHTQLKGAPMDGLDGIRLMPPCETNDPHRRGSPNLGAIGKALKVYAEYLAESNNPNLRLEFSDIVRRVMDTYPGRPTWFADMVQLADSFEWEPWASESLPFLVARNRPLPNGGAEVLCWHFLLLCIPPDYGVDAGGAYCNGRFVSATLGPEASQCLTRIRPVFESEHETHCDPSQKAWSAKILSSISSVIRDASDNSQDLLATQSKVAYHEARSMAWNSSQP